MKLAIGGWLFVGICFVLPPTLYAYAHKDDVLAALSIYTAVYVLFWALLFAVIRGVSAR